jgi:hypothetical protein
MKTKWTVASPSQVLNFCLFFFMLNMFLGALNITFKDVELFVAIDRFFLIGLWPIIVYGFGYSLVSYLITKRKQSKLNP